MPKNINSGIPAKPLYNIVRKFAQDRNMRFFTLKQQRCAVQFYLQFAPNLN